MLGNVLFPSTYVHSHLFNWLSFYVLRNKHAYFYPLSQLFSSYSLWILTKRFISLHFFIVVAKVTWRKKLTTLIPFAWINLQYVHSHYIFATIFPWCYQACSTCSNMDSAHIDPESTTMCILHMSSFFGSNTAAVMSDIVCWRTLRCLL